MPEAPSSEWYRDGLRFACTQCGNCCTGPPGFVWFTRNEARAMAKAVGVPLEKFYDQYARREGEQWSLTEHETEHGLDCVFLDRKTVPGKAICSLYEARPAQCRTWPFWPENVTSPEAWRRVKRTTPCPGMDGGPLIPASEIRIQVEKSREP